MEPHDKEVKQVLRDLRSRTDHGKARRATTRLRADEQIAKAATPALIKMLGDSSTFPRQLAATNLRAIARFASVKRQLAKTVSTLTKLAASRREPMRTSIAAAALLGLLGRKSKSAVVALREIAEQQEGALRREALTALELIEGKRSS